MNGILLANGCAGQIDPPPALGPEASDAERRSVYSQYRLQAIDKDTVVRGTELLDVSQLRALTEACPPAHDRIESRSVLPWIAGGAGVGLFGVGLTRMELSDADDTDDVDIALMGVGAGLAALAIVLELALQPGRQDFSEVTTAYNACLRAELAASAPQAPSLEPLRQPLGPPSQLSPPPLLRIEGSRVTRTSSVVR